MTKKTIEVETKNVWVAWTNSDLTEGRGYDYPLGVFELEATAIRRGKGRYVQGAPCPITKEIAIGFEGKWYVPGEIGLPTPEDRQKDEKMKQRNLVKEKAVNVGLTEEDIQLLIGS